MASTEINVFFDKVLANSTIVVGGQHLVMTAFNGDSILR